jgi:hypothetical protein
MPSWPTQSECVAFYGDPTAPDFEARNIVELVPPFRMVYTDDQHTRPQASIQIHRRCVESLARVLLAVWELCGESQATLERLGCTQFSGSYVNREMRGSHVLSMHAYGCAVDFDTYANPYNAGPEACLFDARHPLVEAFRLEHWTWGGDWTQPRDAMHFQAARVG